jgi:flagellar motor switch protein FliM
MLRAHDERPPLDALVPETVKAHARPQPFPYAALPAISHDEIRTAARLREAAESYVRPEAVAAALTELAGEAVSITVRRTRPLDPARVPMDGVGVAFAHAEESGLSRAALVDVEAALATNLVTRALRQRPPRVLDTSRTTTPELAGALAALLHATLRRAHAGVPLRVVAAGPAPALARDLVGAHTRVATAWLTVVLGTDAFDARVSVPIAELPAARKHVSLSREALVAMGNAPIALPLVIATCLAGRRTLGSLHAGDALVLPRFPLTATSSGRLAGPVAIVPPTAEHGLAAHLGEDGRLMLRSGPLENHPWDPQPSAQSAARLRGELEGQGPSNRNVSIGESMSGEPNPTLEVIEDAPVVVRVELGTLEMTAREWATLTPGDVVTLGRKLGDPAILRVGGVAVARGELVQVDGEYGVRILGRAGGTG